MLECSTGVTNARRCKAVHRGGPLAGFRYGQPNFLTEPDLSHDRVARLWRFFLALAWSLAVPITPALAQATFNFVGPEVVEAECGRRPLPSTEVELQLSGLQAQRYSVIATHSFNEFVGGMNLIRYERTGRIPPGQIESQRSINGRHLEFTGRLSDHLNYSLRVWPGRYRVGLFDTENERSIRLGNLLAERSLLVLPPVPEIFAPDRVAVNAPFSVEISNAVAPLIAGRRGGAMYLIAVNLDAWPPGTDMTHMLRYAGGAAYLAGYIRNCLDDRADFQGLPVGRYELQLRQIDRRREDPLIARRLFIVCDDNCDQIAPAARQNWEQEQWPLTWREELLELGAAGSRVSIVTTSTDTDAPESVEWGVVSDDDQPGLIDTGTAVSTPNMTGVIPANMGGYIMSDRQAAQYVRFDEIGGEIIASNMADAVLTASWTEYLSDISINSETAQSTLTALMLRLADSLGVSIGDLRTIHWARNALQDRNVNFESVQGEGWTVSSPSETAFHVIGLDPKKVTKYVHKDGSEYVFTEGADGNQVLLSDGVNDGTYNHINSSESSTGHFVVDVIPWLLWGTTMDDQTTFSDRWSLLTNAQLPWLSSVTIDVVTGSAERLNNDGLLGTGLPPQYIDQRDLLPSE